MLYLLFLGALPAIILRELPPYGDFLVCGISTQLNKQVKGFDESISSTDDDYDSSGRASNFSRKARIFGCSSWQ